MPVISLADDRTYEPVGGRRACWLKMRRVSVWTWVEAALFLAVWIAWVW